MKKREIDTGPLPVRLAPITRSAPVNITNLMPKTIIVLLSWNDYEMTAECVRSLLVMESGNFEIIIVDNGSTDNSAMLLAQEFPEIKILRQTMNLGFAGGCNVAMRDALTKGAEYVLLLNNDAFVSPDFLHEVLQPMQNDPRIGAVCPKIYFADKPESLWYAGGDFNLWTSNITIQGLRQFDRGQFDTARDITLATGCAMLLRCSALAEVGLFDEKFFAYVEDLDLSVRLRKKGFRIVYAPKARVWHRVGATAVKSMGSGSAAIRQYLSTRNLLFLARKHVRWWQMPTFLTGFLVTHIAFYTALRLWHCDMLAVLAVYRGAIHGLTESIRAPASGNLPTPTLGR